VLNILNLTSVLKDRSAAVYQLKRLP